jgi:hypothetical protein
MDIYTELEKKVLPTLEAYREDLTKHDREIIANNPGTPFLHWSRDYGTHIVMLITADKYPAKGVTIPFLFGHADRLHLVKSLVDMARYHSNSKNGKHTCLYFDGCRLRAITNERAVEIAEKYAEKLLSSWK